MSCSSQPISFPSASRGVTRHQLLAPPPPPQRPLKRKRWEPPTRTRSVSPHAKINRDAYYRNDTEYVDAVTGHHENHFLKLVEQRQRNARDFRTARYADTYTIENIAECSDPDRLLERLFTRVIHRGVLGCTDGRVNKIGLLINSTRLTDPISLTLAPMWQNTPAALLNVFNKVNQSKRDNNLLGAPFTVVVTTVSGHEGSGVVKGQARHNVPDHCKILINNLSDTWCLFHAIETTRIYQHAGEPGHPDHMNKKVFSDFVKSGAVPPNPAGPKGRPKKHPTMYEKTKALVDALAIDKTLASYSAEVYAPLVQQYYDRTYGEGMYRIVIFNQFGHFKPVFKSKVENPRYDIPIFFNGAHFEGIRTPSTFLDCTYYCFDCEKPFQCKTDHTAKCVRKCMDCGRMGPDFPCKSDGRFSKRCSRCKKLFRNEACYEAHAGVMCAKYHKCTDCGVTYSTKQVKRYSQGKHVCGQKMCLFCLSYHASDQPCWIQKIKKPTERLPEVRYVAFDFESRQEKVIDPNRLQHEVNYIVARVMCTECLDTDNWKDLNHRDCRICGPDREKIFSELDGGNPLQQFVSWLLHDLDKRFKTIALSHFGGRYDMVLTLQQLYAEGGLRPEIIANGNKIYEIHVDNTNVVETTFHDSWMLMSQPLSELVDAYDLPIEEKKWFPHLANCVANYQQVLPQLPGTEAYLCDQMSPSKREEFLAWYEQNKHQTFNLAEMLRLYCRSDVEILAYSLAAFRKEWIDLTGDDVLRHSMTIASACMRNYRMNHLEKNSITIALENGYERHLRQSVVALKYLKWYAKENGVVVQHRDSQGGEKQINYVENGANKKYLLDGFVERPAPQRNLAIEFNGCAWHGCVKCFPNRETVGPNGQTAERNYAETMKRQAKLEETLDVVVVWEHECTERLKKCSEMARFFKDCKGFGPINPRDAYFGGRTGPASLKCKLPTGRNAGKWKISYFDITSLYPWSNFFTLFPVGMPTIHVKGEHVQWRCKADNPYQGLIKGVVLPPQDLILPVLPAKFDDRLLFPLCRTCSIEYESKCTRDPDYRCDHTEEQREFVGTFTHDELNAALERGYKLTYLDRAWHWADDQWTDKLFRTYVAQFMQIKAEASNWPDECTTDEAKAEYIEQYKQRYGVTLDATKIRKNKARRQIAKLCLNNLWGRFSMRNNLNKVLVTEKPHEFFEVVFDDRIDVASVEMIDDKHMHVLYNYRKEYVKENASSNIYISLWTTALARLKLLSFMEQIDAADDCMLLYYDTDSVIYLHPADRNPLETGMYLGDMKDEYPHQNITEYYSGGCKQYCLKLVDPTGKTPDEECIKLRGITLNHAALQTVTFESFRDQVLHYGASDPLMVPSSRFELNKKGFINTLSGLKRYLAVCQKGYIDRLFNVLPFGYKGPSPIPQSFIDDMETD